MDLTPPLTGSPASPQNVYCPSETSTTDYPSPELVAQQYRLSSIYGHEPSCSMAPPMDPDTSLPPLDAMAQADWNSTAVPLQQSSAGGAMPGILTTEYDPFAPYDSYGEDIYAAQAHHDHTISHSPPAHGMAHSRSPGPSMSRTSILYSPGAAGVAHGAPRLKLEGPGEYDQAGGDISQYPSPRPGHGHQPGDASGYSQQSTGYLSDGQSSAWSKPDYPPLEPDQYYSGTEGQAAPMFDDGRRGARMPRAQRRVPRRLTTKEEANYQCEVKGCGKLFSRSYNYKAHLETHDEKREYPFPCPVNDCNKKFVRKTDLQRHHQSVHMKERNHRCDYCGRLFARKDTLRR